jgi:hypothetical protein
MVNLLLCLKTNGTKIAPDAGAVLVHTSLAGSFTVNLESFTMVLSERWNAAQGLAEV